MNVSRRFALLTFLASFLLSALLSYVIHYFYKDFDHHLQLFAGIFVLLVLIGTVGKMFWYQQALSRVKQNLDEAQQLAGIGSWERDLVTGKGYWSDNHYRLFNIAPRKVAPNLEEFFLMIHSKDRQQVREAVLEAIHLGGNYELKYRLEGDRDSRTFLSRGKVLRDEAGEAVTLIGSIQDITHKHRRDQFREGLIRQKDLFIARLGHDLKTPLTPLVALLPLIRSRTNDQRQQELLDLCINSAGNIHDLVTKSLTLARLASTADIPLRPLDAELAAVIDSAKIRSEELLGINLLIEVLVPDGLTVRVSRIELEELFIELFNNAVKFSPPDFPVVVEASRDDGMVTVMVKDSGIGLLPEELPHVFEEFYKADSSRHLLESSGLGLTICRRIVEHHGGRITVTSPGRDGGTVVSFTLEAGGSA